jgi:PleD family two-component response regulator
MIQITISMGITCTSADYEKRVDMLLEYANQDWSMAKQNGGNQVVTWRSSTQIEKN